MKLSNNLSKFIDEDQYDYSLTFKIFQICMKLLIKYIIL